jgi:hypothetical protein
MDIIHSAGASIVIPAAIEYPGKVFKFDADPQNKSEKQI